MNTTADAVVITAPVIASGSRASASGLVIGALLLEARHVGHERVEIGRWQRAVLRRHRRFLGGVRLCRGLLRVGNPLLDVVGAQLCTDAIERTGLAALPGDRMAHR